MAWPRGAEASVREGGVGPRWPALAPRGHLLCSESQSGALALHQFTPQSFAFLPSKNKMTLMQQGENCTEPGRYPVRDSYEFLTKIQDF